MRDWIKTRHVFWVFFLFGIITETGVTKTSHSGIRKHVPVFGNIHKTIYPVNRDVPILQDVVVIKRVSAGVFKSGDDSWQKKMQKIGVLSMDPAFSSHEGDGSGLAKIFQLRLLPQSDVYGVCEVLANDPTVEWAEPIYKRKLCYDPNDPQMSLQWYIDKIEARAAWNHRGMNEVIIGIVDTGIYYDHEDLSANIWTNPGEIPDNGKDDDDNGFVDDVRGWDFGSVHGDEPDNDPIESIPIHGTAVAGVAGAITDNGIGIASPAFDVKIMPVKTSIDDDDNHYIVYGYQGIVYAADNGADIINCSFGGSGGSNAGREAVFHAQNMGALVIAAAGNGIGRTPSYPASYPGVLSVAATDQSDLKSWFSNYGYTVDVSAPGSQIFSTWDQNDYLSVNGTSFSSALTTSVAALVKGIHPSWTAEQVREQVRLSADPIDDLNPDYPRQLGRGRINAYRAVTLESPAIRVVDYELTEGTGSNGDGILDPGEIVHLKLQMTNFLEPATGVLLAIHSDHPEITIMNSQFPIFYWNKLGKWNNQNNPVRIQISENAARGQTVDIFIEITANEGYQDFEHINFDISPVYGNIQGGNVRLTLSSVGKLGFIDYPSNMLGDGFVFGNENLLFEGAVMAARVGDRVSDVARGADQSFQNNDFEAVPGGELVIEKPGKLADEQGTAVFTDELADNALNLGILQTSYVFYEPPDDDYVLLAYHLYNLSTTAIQNLYFGLFMDWDVGRNGTNSADNKPGFEPDLSLGYVYDASTSLFGGLSVVSEGGASAYKSIKNDDDTEGIYDGYTDAEKWAHLSGGIQAFDDEVSSDHSHVLGVGPLTLNSGDTLTVGFAVLGGSGRDDLKTNAVAARGKWQALFENTGIDDNSKIIPSTFCLNPNYPNPFNSYTAISYQLSAVSEVALSIFNSRGQKVRTLVNENQPAGHYSVVWNGRDDFGKNVSSGLYLYRLQTDHFAQTRKCLLLE